MDMDTGRAKVVVVTGASAGVGRATARAFGAQGAAVGLIARGRDGLEAARREIEAAGGRALVLVTDVADADQVEAAAARVEAELGPIDIWVNNAMVTVFGPVHATTPAEFRRATEVTYLGTVHGTMAALKRMRPRDRGNIVQVGSALAYRSVPLQAAYCGAKSAIRGFTDSLRCELLHEGSHIRLTMVQLSAFNTPQFDWAHCLHGPRAAAAPADLRARGGGRRHRLGIPARTSRGLGRLARGQGDPGQSGDPRPARSDDGKVRIRRSAGRSTDGAGATGQSVRTRCLAITAPRGVSPARPVTTASSPG